MKTLVVYHSRTGTTTKVAQRLAATLKADVVEINYARNRLDNQLPENEG